MVRRFIRDEAGMTMALVVIMIVVIGVMGAGLLTFVNRDLETVVEVNQGQRALETADAGVQVARTHLRADADKVSYNGVNNPSATPPDPESEWSYSGTGKNLTFNSNSVNVKIQYLVPTPSNSPSLANDPAYAPEVLLSGATDYANNKRYFKVVSEGRAGPAKRKIEAIFYTEDLNFPRAYVATSTVDLSSSSTRLKCTSLFTRGSILSMPDDLFGKAGDASNPPCQDAYYKNWNNTPWNNKSRTVALAGAAAEGTIDYKSSADKTANYGKRDFDKLSASTGSGWSFVNNAPWAGQGATGSQRAGEISYPFDPLGGYDLEFLKDYVQSSSAAPGSRYVRTNATTHEINELNYPETATQDTVYIVEFMGAEGQVDYKVSPSNPYLPRKGTIIVLNGSLKPNNSSKGFEGLFIVRDPGNQGLIYDLTGNFDLTGYVNVQGEMKLRGSTDNTSLPPAFFDRPGFYGVNLWSWRELYE